MVVQLKTDPGIAYTVPGSPWPLKGRLQCDGANCYFSIATCWLRGGDGRSPISQKLLRLLLLPIALANQQRIDDGDDTVTK